MRKMVLYGVGGVAALVVVAAVVKKKGPGARKYIAAKGDKLGAVMARFRLPVRKADVLKQLTPGQAIPLPAQVTDSGARVMARGRVV